MSEILKEEYQNHEVFLQLKELSEFYNDLSFKTMRWLSSGTLGIINLDSQVFSSISGTIQSIEMTLRKGKINDSFALLRKYYDSTIINVYSSLYLEDNFSIENFVVTKIVDWIYGKEKLPEYRVMSKYIRDSEKLKPITNLLLIDNRYKIIRDRCNDHTHYNFYRHMLLNNSEIYLQNRIKMLDIFLTDLQQLFIQHFAFIFYLHSNYMMASDHIDYLDLGMEPPEDSQYWVSSFVQEIFDKVVNAKRPDIGVEIKKNSEMKLK